MREGPRDECGVVGLYPPGPQVGPLSYLPPYPPQPPRPESPGSAPAPPRRGAPLAHTGNLTTRIGLTGERLGRGVSFSPPSDWEIIAAMIAPNPAESVEDAIAEVLPRLRGAFSIVAMTKDRVVAFRDPHGLRPLAIGVLEPAPEEPDGKLRYCVASESCAFDIIGAKFLRDVEPGELVTRGEDGPQSRMVVPGGRRALR